MDMAECIANCTECHRICLETVAYCLNKGGRHAGATHVTLLLDCEQICAASADFMIRGSEFHSRSCGVCADICQRCADECETMADDETMARCAEICRRCAASCREMARAA
jgi:hypothetical protein